MSDINLTCACGSVRGRAHNVSPTSGTRIVCHCDDCQSYASYLGTGNILDAYGGTDIFQMFPGDIEITDGKEYIACVKLRRNGMHRWYANCCKTPMGNTLSAGMPFIGVIHNFIDLSKEERDRVMGPVRGYVQTKFALEHNGDKRKETHFLAVAPRIAYKMLEWKIRGINKKTFFFDQDGNPVVEPLILGKN